MAKGDQTDIFSRLQSLLPGGWFTDSSVFLSGLLAAGARTLSWCHTLYLYARRQTRIATASDGWLDMAAFDFLGNRVKRVGGVPDDVFRQQIMMSLFREQGTRQAIVTILEEITGNTPEVFEPQCPGDTGVYGGPGLGYGMAGGYGSRLMPYQAFVVAYTKKRADTASVAGNGSASRGEYVPRERQTGEATDAQIYAAVAAAKMEGTVVWVRVE